MNTRSDTDSTGEKPKPAITPKYFSHATLACRDARRTKQFLEEFLGFETVWRGPAGQGFWARLRGSAAIVVMQMKDKPKMPFSNHNGLDVSTKEEVDAAYELAQRDAQKWGLSNISKPRSLHGSYSFYFWDGDDNAWEILTNPAGGYDWAFDGGEPSYPDSVNNPV